MSGCLKPQAGTLQALPYQHFPLFPSVLGAFSCLSEAPGGAAGGSSSSFISPHLGRLAAASNRGQSLEEVAAVPWAPPVPRHRESRRGPLLVEGVTVPWGLPGF